MSTNFVTLFLSQPIDAKEAIALFIKEKPDLNCLSNLIGTLSEQKPLANLQTLLFVLMEQKEKKADYIPLLSRIHSIFLMHGLNTSDNERIVKALKALNILLVEDKQILWQETLALLTEWVEHKAKEPVIRCLIGALPTIQREQLYDRLLTNVSNNPSWLSSLVQFVIINYSQASSSSSQQPNFTNLSRSLLLAPAEYDTKILGQLTRFFDTTELLSLINQIQAIAASYSPLGQEEEQADRFVKTRLLFQKRYDDLVTALTILATKSNLDYLNLVERNSTLANTLILKRLNIEKAAHRKKELVVELLTQHRLYDWQDPNFKAAVDEYLLSNIAQLTQEQWLNCFQLYYQCHQSSEVVRFLDILFRQSQNRDMILDCIQQVDDKNQTFTILFISQSIEPDSFLFEECFDRLNTIDLINLCSHVLSLRQIRPQDGESLPLVFCSVLCKKIRLSSNPADFFSHLASTLVCLPEQDQNAFITPIFNLLVNDSQLKFVWLSALFSKEVNKSNLFTHCYEVIRASRATSQVILLNYLSAEELLNLYLHMIQSKAIEQDYQCMITLLMKPENQPKLFYLLLNTPSISRPLFEKLINALSDKNLILLVYEMLEKVETSGEILSNLQMLLPHFCMRLQKNQNRDVEIHQWLTLENQDSPLIQHWIYTLLKDPVCFSILTLGIGQNDTASGLKSFVQTISLQSLWASTTDNNLRLGINRLLNLIHLDLSKLQSITLNLLNTYRLQPKKIQAIFKNLEAGRGSLDDRGQQNYSQLKQCCWMLLKTGQPYDEMQASHFLTSNQLQASHCFDPLLIMLANNLSKNQDPNLSAQYLSQTVGNSLEQIPNDTLITILLHSMQESTEINWTKVATHFASKDLDQGFIFVKQLVSRIRSSTNNPLLIEKSWHLIVQLIQSTELLLLLENDQLQWLVGEAKAPDLMALFPGWFDKIMQKGHIETIDCGALIALLPQHGDFISSIYQHKALSAHLVKLFTELCKGTKQDVSFFALEDRIDQESTEARRHFILEAQRSLSPHSMAPSAIHFINNRLLKLPHLQAHNPDDINLIIEHLRFLLKLNLTSEYGQKQSFIRQLTLNTLTSLNDQDAQWSSALLLSETFIEIILTWLQEIDIQLIDQHLFTRILLENLSVCHDYRLINNPLYQRFIMQLLRSPPASLDNNQFNALFSSLTKANKEPLAQEILEKSSFNKEQWASLFTLANVLPVERLFSIYEADKTRLIFIELLSRHPSGLETLSEVQKDALLGNINSGQQLFRILNSYSPYQIKINFVQAIFDYLRRNNLPLSSWLEQLNLDTQTLAAIANFTTKQNDQFLLKQLIDDLPYRNKAISDYLQEATLDMMPAPSGLLFSMMRQIWLDPWSGRQIDPALLIHLDLPSKKRGVRAQFQLLKQVIQLQKLYGPMTDSEQVSSQTLCSARWILHLPLLTNGVLEVVNYQKRASPAVQEQFIQTTLYKQLIAHLTSNKDSDNLAINQLGELPTLLEDYANKITAIDPSHQERIRHAILTYKQEINCISHFSFPEIAKLFSSDAYFPRLRNQREISLNKNEIALLVQAKSKHKSWIEKHFPLQEKINHFLGFLSNNPALVEDQALRSWLINDCLFSPVIEYANDEQLLSLLNLYPVNELVSRLGEIQQQLVQYKEKFALLQSYYNKDTSIQALINRLINMSYKEVDEQLYACEFAQQPYLANLLEFVLQAQSASLNEPQLQKLVLPAPLTNHLDFDWINKELSEIAHVGEQLDYRLGKLAILRLCFTNDGLNSERLSAISSSFLLNPGFIDDLVTCLNSYSEAFSAKGNRSTCTKLLEILNKILEPLTEREILLSKLNGELRKSIISFALNDPKQHESLLEKMIRAGFAEVCRNAIDENLNNRLNPTNKKYKASSRKKAPIIRQLADLSKEELYQVLFLLRLQFHIQPMDELMPWLKQQKEKEKEKEKALAANYFCADASLYNYLLNNGAASNPIADILEQGLNFLRAENKSFYYLNLITQLQQKNKQDPVVYYYWLCLTFFVTQDLNLLHNCFTDWLLESEPDQLKTPYLIKLLGVLLKEMPLNELCQGLAAIQKPDKRKLSWLFEQLIHSNTAEEILKPEIIRSFSWECIEEQIKSGHFHPKELLQIALGDPIHSQTILSKEENKLNFFSLLDSDKLSANELIDLQAGLSNPQLRSLIAVQLLSRQDYLKELPGCSILSKENLSAPKNTPIRRLQPLINLLDLTSLPVVLLEKLKPEAVANLFCSIKHFHQLPLFIEPLLKTKGVKTTLFINYWLTHYASMPNAELLLIALVKQFPEQLKNNLVEMQKPKRAAIIKLLIQQMDKLNLEEVGFIIPLCNDFDESYLTYAIQLYFGGRQTDQSLIQFITAITQRSLDSNVELSAKTKQLLFKLSEEDYFPQLHDCLYRLNCDYLQQAALNSDCSVFYDQGQINIHRAGKQLPLNEEHSNELDQGIVEQIASALKKFIPIDRNKNSASPTALNERISKQSFHIKAIDYFLRIYRGRQERLHPFLTQYLNHFSSKNNAKTQAMQLHDTAALMNQYGLTDETRQTIYQCFLAHPSLFDAEISTELLRFQNAETIRHFGTNRQYQTVINLCTQALTKLDNDDEGPTREIAERARNEAVFEASLAGVNGFFRGLRCWFRRGSFYGWSAWLRPNPPSYVASFDHQIGAVNTQSTNLILNQLNQPPAITPENLSSLLNQFSVHVSIEFLDQFNEALAQYEVQANKPNETAMREQINVIYINLLERSKTESNIDNWLFHHHELFGTNHKLLLGLYCKTGRYENLIQLMNKGSNKPLAHEFSDSPQVERLASKNELSSASSSGGSILGTLASGSTAFLAQSHKHVSTGYFWLEEQLKDNLVKPVLVPFEKLAKTIAGPSSSSEH